MGRHPSSYLLKEDGISLAGRKNKKHGFSMELEGNGHWKVQEFHTGLLTE